MSIKLTWSLLLFVSASSWTTLVLGELSLEQVADKLCNQPNVIVDGVARVRSMTQLASYFEQLPSNGHPFSECRNKYIESLRSLNEVLTVGNDDVCGDVKVSAIEDFNRKFLSTRRRDVDRQKKDKLKAPKLVEVFFMHYAYLVSIGCKQYFVKQFNDKDIQIGDKTANLDEILHKFSKAFGLDLTKRGYDDLILPWALIDGLPSSSKTKKYIRDPFIDSKNPVPVRISIQANGTENFQSMQRACATHFKPVYSDMILPVIRLTGVGLYWDHESLEVILRENESARRLFGIAQLCETILPVETFQSSSLKAGQAVVLTVESANSMRVGQLTDRLETAPESYSREVPSRPSLSDPNLALVSLKTDTDEANRLSSAITANRIKQERVLGRFRHIVMPEIKSQMSRFTKFIKGTSVDGSSVEVALESAKETETGDELVRTKRSFKKIKDKLHYALNATLGVIFKFFVLVVMFVSFLAYIPYFCVQRSYVMIRDRLKSG